MRAFINFIVVCVLVLPGLCFCDYGPRQMEKLGRGVVAVDLGDKKVFISWRLLGTDSEDVAFNVYRGEEKLNSEPITGSTNYVDNDAGAERIYSVRAVVEGVEQNGAKGVKAWEKQYLTVPLQTPKGYRPNDASVGDLDGDGEYEIVLHQAGKGKDNSQKGFTDPPILEAYKIDGTLLWRINLGRNIREGAHYTQFMVYDFDCDGKAEIACKTADGTVDGVGKVIGDAKADWRNKDGYILEGPEYLTVFDGLTGAAVDTVDYVVGRGDVAKWGDNYGNRVDRFLAGAAYLDGERPSLVMCRGYYTRSVLAAWDFRDGKLKLRWVFDSDDGTKGNRAYRGQGNHSLSVADVDGDGKDEIVYGACVIDDDGTGLHSTGYGHGDALHVSDLDPDRAGLEVFTIHEGDNPGSSFRDGHTGEILWKSRNADVGRGLAADIDPRHKGYECWGFGGLWNCKGRQISRKNPSSVNMAVWWDGDLLRELLNGTVIDKWDWQGEKTERLLTAYKFGADSNNGSKANPCLCADLFGDWREEVIWRHADNQSLLIFTTTIPTKHRLYTLMHDPQYRLGVAWQNVGYNQPSQVGFYLGQAMDFPAKPDIAEAGK